MALKLKTHFLKTLIFQSQTLRYSTAAADAAAKSLSESLISSPSTTISDQFPNLKPTLPLVETTLKLSSSAAVIPLTNWLSATAFTHSDDSLSILTHHLAKNHHFPDLHLLLSANRHLTGPKTVSVALRHLARAGRATLAAKFFNSMESDYSFPRNKETLTFLIESLCSRGHAAAAERLSVELASEFFPDDRIVDALISGWCVAKRFDEARRLAAEVRRGGFNLSTAAYNSMLNCVCRLSREKDVFKMKTYAEAVLAEMDEFGVARDVGTFNVLVSNFCKVRWTDAALGLMRRMGEWGLEPDSETYLILVKSLYQAGRVGEGDAMVEEMTEAGFLLQRIGYYDVLKILCGIERVDHALLVFERMKKAEGCEPGVKTYELLMGRLCALGRPKEARILFKEAVERGVGVVEKEYPEDPRFAKMRKEARKKAEARKVKKRETLPEKTARKRNSLKKFRLSFVKKSKRGLRSA